MTSRQIHKDKQTLRVLDIEVRKIRLQEKRINQRKTHIMRTLQSIRSRYK
jgi:hypothetical protein